MANANQVDSLHHVSSVRQGRYEQEVLKKETTRKDGAFDRSGTLNAVNFLNSQCLKPEHKQCDVRERMIGVDIITMVFNNALLRRCEVTCNNNGARWLGNSGLFWDPKYHNKGTFTMEVVLQGVTLKGDPMVVSALFFFQAAETRLFSEM